MGRKKKRKNLVNDDYDYDRSNAFGYSDYNSQFRNILNEHYVDDYDYEDYSYNHFFQKTFLPQIVQDKTKRKSNHKYDKKSESKSPKVQSPSDISKRLLTEKSEDLPEKSKLKDNRKKSSSKVEATSEKRRYDQLEVRLLWDWSIAFQAHCSGGRSRLDKEGNSPVR